jgi:hypothetical protein
MGYVIEQERKHTLDPNYVNYVILNKSNHSYAINNKLVEVMNSESWLNKKCFILGGGPSLKGFDFSQLDTQLTIGINRAFQYYPNEKINYSMDSDFYDKMKRGDYNKPGETAVYEQWLAFKGLKVFLTPMELKSYGQEVRLVKKLFYKSVSRDLEQGIYGGCNSGLGAIMLAIAIGANPIYLLGYDMQTTERNHWHDGYPEKKETDFNSKLTQYRHEIEEMVPLFNKIGVQIFQTNKDSALKCFPNIDLNYALTH